MLWGAQNVSWLRFACCTGLRELDAQHAVRRLWAIHGLFHIHALRKPNPRFAQVIHGLSGQSMDIADPRFAQDNPWMVPIHGLRRTYI